MVKRKFKQNQKVSDDEGESQRPVKQFKKPNSTIETSLQNTSLSSVEEHNNSMDNGNLPETSNIAADDSYYESFSSFMKAFSFYAESEVDYQKCNDAPRNVSYDCGNSVNISERRDHEEMLDTNSTSNEMILEEQKTSIRILSLPSKLKEVVLLQHPTSLTLHGYVRVSVQLGSINIFGYKVKEGEHVEVFSTEGTGLKEVVTLQSVHKSTIRVFEKKLQKVVVNEDINIKEFLDNIGPTTVVLIIKELPLPASLQLLELYYPNALQTKWPKSKNFTKKKSFELCSTEQAFVIDISDDFKYMSHKVNKAIDRTVSENEFFGPRIMVKGDKNMGKSTLLRYLMNSSLSKYPEVYFFDTDPGQTEYTPPGVVSLFRVTKPLLGPPFTHQKKALKMIFLGATSPAKNPKLYERSVGCLVEYYKRNFVGQPLFVNTMGWTKGLGGECIKSIYKAVKPTILIELISPEPELIFERKVIENGRIHLRAVSKAPSRERGTPSFNAKELRNFSLVAYLGQCQKHYLPVSWINACHPVCVNWDKVALYSMGGEVPNYRLIQAMHSSFVALCHVNPAFIIKSDNPAFPMTLIGDVLCHCFGFGLLRSSDETNRELHIITPLTQDQLKKVNAIIKGDILIPDEIMTKQTLRYKSLPFVVHSQVPKALASKALCRRAHFRTPNRKA